MPQISRTARLAIYNRLSDSVLGYNARVNAIATAYSVDPSALLINDWTLGGSNFIFGTVNPDAVDASSDYTYPFCSIDTGTAANENLVVSSEFSGVVPVLTYMHLSWRDARALPNFADYSDCAEQALFDSVNDLSNFLRGSGWVYNGRSSCEKGQIATAGLGWRRSLKFTSLIEVIT